MDDVLDRHGAHRSVERLVVKGQPRRLVQVVDDVISQSRIVSHLLCVQPQTNDFAGPKVPRQVRTPATHQVEKLPAGGQHLGIQPSQRGDRPVVDMDDLARVAVELRVRRFIVARVCGGRKQTISPDQFGRHVP